MTAEQASRAVCIIGDGAWGTALGLVLHENGHRVTMWGPFPDYIETVRSKRENVQFLPNVALPPEISWSHDREEAASGAELVVLAIPTKYFQVVTASFAGLIPDACRVVSVAKGLAADTRERMTQVAERALGLGQIAALSGPSHAEEVARGIPTAVVIASQDSAVSSDLQSLFTNGRFRAYTTRDVAGVELGGALKNVIAIAVGAADGLGFGDNTRAALITRGLAEMSRLGCAMGAEPATFTGLSGMGDLIVTCTSRHSRNRAVGERIGRGERVEDILSSTQQAVEGVWNCASAHELARECHVEVPVTDEVYAVVHDGKNPREAVRSLLSRGVKSE